MFTDWIHWVQLLRPLELLGILGVLLLVDGTRYALESDSGDITVRMKQELFGQLTVLLRTICGELGFEELAELGESYPSNDQHVMAVSSTRIPGGALAEPESAPDLYVKTRDGNVTIEKMA